MTYSKHSNVVHQQLSLTGMTIDNAQLDNINQLSSRQAMALPDYALSSNIDDLSEEFKHFKDWNRDELVTVVESIQRPFKQRYAAGQLLALLGDPRIDTFNPMMQTIPADKVSLGLESQQIENVVQQYAQYGVLEEWIAKETPQYTQSIKPFKIAKYCVTHQEYHQFLVDTQYPHLPQNWAMGMYPQHLANHPVHSIQEQDAEAYITWLNTKTARRFRLPTEAEWEYAAAGSQGYEFPWGEQFMPDHCNTVETGIAKSTPIGTFPKGASPFQCMDMAGNVEEYVADDYYPYDQQTFIDDDLRETQGNYRIARGGSFTRFRDLARTKRRHGRYDSELYVMGFRLAESIL